MPRCHFQAWPVIMSKVIVAEPLSECVTLITTELASDCRTEEGDQFSRAKIKASSKLSAIVSIVRAQVERKVKENKTREAKCIVVFPDQWAMPK